MSKNRHQNRNFTIPTTKPTTDEKPNVAGATPEDVKVGRGMTAPFITFDDSLFTQPDVALDSFKALFKDADTNEIATVVLPEVAHANPELFYEANGRNRTVGEVIQAFEQYLTELNEKTDELLSETPATTESTNEASESSSKDDASAILNELAPRITVNTVVEQDAEGNEVERVESVIRDDVIAEPEVPFYKKPVGEWTLEQLETYIKGEVEDVSFNVLKAAITEHQRREAKLDKAWNPQQCKEFLTMGIVPAKTSKGAWKDDITRFARKPASWATQELESWALGEIKAGGVASEPHLALELKTRLNLRTSSNSTDDVILAYKSQTGATTSTVHLTGTIPTTPTPAVNVEEAKIELSYAGLTKMNQTYIEATLSKYLEIVGPGKPVSVTTGVSAQKQLDNVIRYVINLEDPQGFKSGMDLLLTFIKKHRKAGGLFDDSYAFRFTDGLNPQGGIQESHIKILTLFFIFADENKEARSQYDVPSLVALFPVQRQPFLLHYFQNVA